MKLTIFLLTAAFLQVSAKSHSQTVTFSGKNVKLETVFGVVEAQTGYAFFYNDADVKNARPVTAELKEVPLDDALKVILKGQPLDYSIAGKTIVVKAKGNINTQPENIATQPFLSFIPITGVITDSTGKPLQGANIEVKGTKKRTSTDQEGRFLIDAKEGDVLVVSYVGYGKQEIKVSKETSIRITLKINVAVIEGVTVNTGYEKINRERFVGAYQQMDSQAFHSRPGMGIIQRLDGRVNSVFFQKKDVSLGGPSIMIRGLGTLGTANQANGVPPTSWEPLVVVDNFPMPSNFKLENFNVNDVESITVLTDAAAASIWGTRAGNGVIVITTKRGRYNQKLQTNFSSNISITQKPDLFYHDRISTSQYIDMERYLFGKGAYNAQLNNVGVNGNFPSVTPVVEILDRQRRGLLTEAQANAQIDALRNVDIRDQLNKYLNRNAISQQYYLSANGGTNVLAYQFSGGFNRTLNGINGSKPDHQYTLNTNVTIRPLKNLEIVTGLNLSLSKIQSINSVNTPGYPYGQIIDETGNSVAVIQSNVRMAYIDTVGGGNLLDWHYRPLDEIKYYDNVSNARGISMSAALNYKFRPWLTGSVQYQLQNSLSSSRNFYSLKTYFARDLINTYTDLNQPVAGGLRYPIPVGGILDVGGGFGKAYNLRGSLNFAKSFGADHQVNGMIAGDVSDNKGGYSSGTRVYGYDPTSGVAAGSALNYVNTYPLFYAPAKGINRPIPYTSLIGDGNEIMRIVSVSSNASYTYKNRYNIYASARRDGSNLFGVSTNNKWKPLWSAGASWDISKERFYRSSIVPYIRIRGSYGYTGNVNNQLSGVLTFVNYPTTDPVTGLPFSYANKAANSNLKWEEVVITNGAMDFALLKSRRVSGSFSMYRKKAQDLISLAPNPMSTGVTEFVGNYANLLSTGYEISLSSQNIKGVINWNTSFNWSHSKTTIKDLFFTRNPKGFRVSDYTNHSLNAYPGEVIFGLASYRWGGLDPLTGDPIGYYNGQLSKNYNGIATDSIQNQVFHGSSLPLSTANLRNTINWKGFSLAMNLTGRFQFYFREPVVDINNPLNLSPDFFNRWQKPGDEAFTSIPSIYYGIPGAVSSRSTIYSLSEIHVKRGDNIRVQDVNLSWSWSNKKSKAIPFASATFFGYLNGINWIVWRKESSKWDPDFVQGGPATAGQIAPPPPKSWTFGLTLGF